MTNCNTAPRDPYLNKHSVAADATPGVTEVAPEYAAAGLPSLAGAIHSVRQTVAPNRLRQEIVYENLTALPGENLLTVNVGPPDSANLLRPPSAADVLREMRAALPASVTPRMSAIIGQNARGTYGYATANIGATGACIYAWQLVKSVSSGQTSGFSVFGAGHLAAQIRLRYCHPAVNVEQIHLLMDGLRLKDIDGRAIDMLRFAAGSGTVSTPALVAQPPLAGAVATAPEPVAVARKTKVSKAAEPADDDWKKDASAPSTPAVAKRAAVAVPLPEPAAQNSETDPGVTQAPVTTPAVTVPLPE